jgi:hypothetical protein
VQKKAPGGETAAVSAAGVAKDLLELHYMTEIVLAETNVDAVSDLESFFSTLKPASGLDTIVVLHSAERTRIGVIEGSHRGLSKAELREIGLMEEHVISLDRLLVLNTAIIMEPRGAAPLGGITVFYAQGT